MCKRKKQAQIKNIWKPNYPHLENPVCNYSITSLVRIKQQKISLSSKI